VGVLLISIYISASLLTVNGDTPTFDTKERHTLTMCISYYSTNQRRVSRNARLALVKKAGMSLI
jgi:hypothetical protein